MGQCWRLSLKRRLTVCNLSKCTRVNCIALFLNSIAHRLIAPLVLLGCLGAVCSARALWYTQPIILCENAASVRVVIYAEGTADTNAVRTVDYFTVDGQDESDPVAARAGRDYVAARGSIAFAPGQTAATVEIPLLDNGIIDGGRNFGLVFTNLSPGLTLWPMHERAWIRIEDNEVSPLLDADFSPASVTFATRNGSAQAGVDFEALGGILHYVPLDVSKELVVRLLPPRDQQPRRFTLELSQPSIGYVVGSPATIQIASGVQLVAESLRLWRDPSAPLDGISVAFRYARPGTHYHLEFSIDFRQWQSIGGAELQASGYTDWFGTYWSQTSPLWNAPQSFFRVVGE